MIRVGTAGWNYKDWKGVVYPLDRPRAFSELEYLSGFFDCVEINSSYYGPPKPETSHKWLTSVAGNPAFQFTAKLFHTFSHERKPAPNDEKEFKDGIDPIVEAGKLGALLIQFPWSFKNEPENAAYLWKLLQRFAEYPLVVEVRHASWITDAVLDVLAERGVGIANIDQPLFHRSVKPGAHATSNVAYGRCREPHNPEGREARKHCGLQPIHITSSSGAYSRQKHGRARRNWLVDPARRLF